MFLRREKKIIKKIDKGSEARLWVLERLRDEVSGGLRTERKQRRASFHPDGRTDNVTTYSIYVPVTRFFLLCILIQSKTLYEYQTGTPVSLTLYSSLFSCFYSTHLYSKYWMYVSMQDSVLLT